MDKTLEELLAEQPADVIAAADRRLLELIEESGIGFVREALGQTQGHIAQMLGRSQAYVSKLEHQTDMLLSTLRSYVQAAGGDLQLKVIFPGGEMTAGSLGELAELRSISVYPTPRPEHGQWACHSSGEVTHYSILATPERTRPVAIRKPAVATAPVQVVSVVEEGIRAGFAACG